MSQVLNTFLEWFNQRTPSEQAEITHFICNRVPSLFQDGVNAGPAPRQERGYYAGQAPRLQSHYCPHCGKPL